MKKAWTPRVYQWISASLFAFTLSGCYVFSSFQSAAIVPPGSFVSTVAVTRNDWSDSRRGWSDSYWTNYEFRGRKGTGNKSVDTGMRLVVARVDGGTEAQFGLDGRFGIVPQRLTFQFPATFWFVDEAIRTPQFEPTLIASAPITKSVEFNASWSYRIQPEGGRSSYSGSLGLAVETPFANVRIRPEFAWLGGIASSEGLVYRQFGVALEFVGQDDGRGDTDGDDEPWW